MSSPQAIDTEKLKRAETIARNAFSLEKSRAAADDAIAKDKAVLDAQDGIFDMTNAVAQAGRTLARSIIETRLRSLNPNLRFERSKMAPDQSGIYLSSTFLCGMMWEPSPEFTVNIHGEDENGRKQLLSQIRGWRTVLDALIRKGVIEAEATYKLFEVRKGRESLRWSALHA
jgi:hypothetical protein